LTGKEDLALNGDPAGKKSTNGAAPRLDNILLIFQSDIFTMILKPEGA
jgi:hypothetical protein